MPFALKKIAVRPEMPDYSANFMRWKSSVDGHIEVVKPKLGFMIARAHMNMRRLVAFV
jgi:hypothetical protein